MRRHSFFGFVTKILIVSISTVSLISYNSNDDYNLLFLKQKATLNEKTSTDVRIAYHAPKKETQTTVGSVGAVNGTMGSVSGLNLALISQLNEGYIKELLTIYANLSNGEYTNYAHHISVEALLGMQLVETNYYSGLSAKIPKSYLPCDEQGVVWNRAYNGLSASEMTLANFGDPQWVKLMGSVGAFGDWAGDHMSGDKFVRSPFQIESELTIPSNVNNAVYNGKTDQHLLANILTWVDTQNDKMITNNNVPVEKLTQFQLDCLVSTAHNRGVSAARTMPYGITYSPYGDFNSKLSREYHDTDIYAYNVICEMFTNYMGRDKIGDLLQLMDAASPRWAAVVIACHEDWFFTKTLYDLSVTKANDLCRVWNVLYPEEGMTVTSCLEQVRSRVRILPDAINEINKTSLTSADTENVYGTKGDFSEGGYNARGYMFKVSNKTSTKYTNKYTNGQDPYIVTSYEVLTAGHNFASSVLGSYWYGYLLQVGGLTSVDPTNPSTYLNGLQSGVTGDAPSLFQAAITTGISSKRAELLHAAASQVNVAGYYWSGMLENQYFDCSRFMMWCYSKIGVNISYTTTSLYNSLGTSSTYRQISLAEAMPGDILVCRGHTMMFISYNSTENKLYAVDCGGAGNDGKIHPVSEKPGRIGVRYGFRGNITIETSTAGDTLNLGVLTGTDTAGVIALNDSGRYYKIVRVNQMDTLDAQEQSTYVPQSIVPSFNTITGTRLSVTSEETELLYKIVAAESMGETFEGQAAVAEVILNRIDDNRFPNTIYDVIYAPNQFEPVASGSINTAYAKCGEDVKSSIQKAVASALNGSNHSGGALFFRTKCYHTGRTPTKQIGNHYFSK